MLNIRLQMVSQNGREKAGAEMTQLQATMQATMQRTDPRQSEGAAGY